MVSFFDLFRFADSKDKFLMVIGTIATLITGILRPGT
jgi:hypothetical protein